MPAILVNDVSPVISYTATAGQTLFSIPFEFFAVQDIVVERAGVTLTYSPTPANNNQFSVIGANLEGGGSITLGSPGATLGDKIVIFRDIAIERLANYPETGPMAVRSLNAEQAKHIGMMQQLERDVNRSVTVPIGESSIDLPSAAERAEKILTFDAAGAPVTEFDIGLLTGAVISSGAAPAQNIEFTATASQTVFNFVYDAIPTYVSVFLNGVKLPSTDFTHSGTTVTLLTPATVGDRVALEGFTQSAILEALATLGLSSGSSLVGFIHSGADAVATTVENKFRRTFYAADFTSVQKAIDRAAAEGGGVVIADNFSWNTNITIPNGVDLVGQRGKHGTTFTATGANAKLTFVGENRGGASGGFTLDGAGLSNLLLEIGVSVARTFQDMKVHQSAQDGAWLKGTQNCLFSEVDFEHCGRDNFILDLGAGNNLFVKCEFNRGGKKSLKIVQSGASPTGGFPSGPTSNHFLQCVVERLGWVSPVDLGDPNTGDNIIYIGAGSDNIFTGGSFGLADSTPALSTTKSMIKLVRDNVSYPNQGTVFNNVAIQGDNPYTTAFEVGPNCELILQGVTKFENHLTAIGADDLASIRLLGIETYGTVTNKFANINAGTAAFEALARHTLRGRRIYEASAVGQVISEVSVSGDTNARLVRYPFADVYGSGSSAARATVAGGMDFGIPTLQLSDFNGGAEFLIKKGAVYEHHTTAAGVPTIALPNGSVSYSSNGNGAVYIRIAGAWQTLTIP